MNDAKYIGLDVHQATISAAVLDSDGRLVMESILETKAATVLQFIHGLRGSLHITFEEGTCAAWLHALLQPYVTRVVVCDPRKNALLKAGNKNDRIDARKLADLLRSGLLSPVYHGENGIRMLKELARSYLAVTQDLTRVMGRLKALYRSWAIPCAGERVYSPRHRQKWLDQVSEPGVRRRAEFYYQQIDALRVLHREVKHDFLLESQKHPATELLRQIPSIGPIRAALLVALIQTPHRFRTKRQLWAYSGLGLKTYSSGEYRIVAWTDSKNEETRLDPRAQPQPQSRSEKYLQGCGHPGFYHPGACAGFLCRYGGSRNEAGDGASDAGSENCRDHFVGLEERSSFRR